MQQVHLYFQVGLLEENRIEYYSEAWNSWIVQDDIQGTLLVLIQKIDGTLLVQGNNTIF
jgi:hypothetical protein